jgi:FAD/FMN-containing dehydrogenase
VDFDAVSCQDITEMTKIQRLVGACCGHIGDSNFLSAIFYNEAEKENALQLVSDIERLGIQLEGTATGGHGIGLEKWSSVVVELGPTVLTRCAKSSWHSTHCVY